MVTVIALILAACWPAIRVSFGYSGKAMVSGEATSNGSLADCFGRGRHDGAANTEPDDPAGDARRHELVSRAGGVERADRPPRHRCGAELAVLCQHHRDPANDLAAYEVHRGTTSDFTPSAATLVATVNAHDTSFVDTTASASSGPHAGDYFYMVAVRTRSGQLISGATRFVQLPRPGRTEFVLPVDAAATLASGSPDTVVDPSGFSLSVSPDIAGSGAERAIFEFGSLKAIPAVRSWLTRA